MRITTTKYVIGLVAVASLFGVACGSKKSTPDTTVAAVAPETTVAAVAPETTAVAPPETAVAAAPETTVASAAKETTVAASAAAETTVAGAAAPVAVGTAYTMKEWAIEGPATLKAGKVSLTVTNNGSFPHQFEVIKGKYADLPKGADGGSIAEDKLPAGALVGQLDKFEGGQTMTLALDLPAGDYVFLCRLGAGPNSHAGKGQHTDVTVA